MERKTGWMEKEEHAFLRKGRAPYARAVLEGTEDLRVSGEISFYDTPAGVMVSAELEGLPQRGSVYGFCFCEDSLHSASDGKCLCRSMPLVYDRNGSGRCTLVTESLRRIPLCGRRIALKESILPSLCHASVLAEGIIQ